MTQEEKKLLLKDLCARLPYGVIVQYSGHNTVIKNKLLTGSDLDCNIEYYKPYLRSMSSMTKEEDKVWQYYKNAIVESCDERLEERISELHDWFAANHFDYHGLIPKNLAIEAPEEMYEQN